MSDAPAPSPAPPGVPRGVLVVSILVLLAFAGAVGYVLVRGVPAQSEALLNVLLGALGAMASSVVSYWVGSSAGSARKDERLERLGR